MEWNLTRFCEFYSKPDTYNYTLINEERLEVACDHNAFSVNGWLLHLRNI